MVGNTNTKFFRCLWLQTIWKLDQSNSKQRLTIWKLDLSSIQIPIVVGCPLNPKIFWLQKASYPWARFCQGASILEEVEKLFVVVAHRQVVQPRRSKAEWKPEINDFIKIESCFSTGTCKVLLNQPHSKLGQHCPDRCSILTRRDNRRRACLVLLCVMLTPLNTDTMHPHHIPNW